MSECYLQDEDEEFDHLSDDEEFEGFDPDASPKGKGGAEKPPDLKFAKVCCFCRYIINIIVFWNDSKCFIQVSHINVQTLKTK